MATCGICLTADKSANCVKCMVCICKSCTSVLNDTQQNETIILCWMCAGKFTVSTITFRKFCRGCETIGHEIYFDNGKCYGCNWVAIKKTNVSYSHIIRRNQLSKNSCVLKVSLSLSLAITTDQDDTSQMKFDYFFINKLRNYANVRRMCNQIYKLKM